MPANDGTPDTWFGLIRSKTGNVVLSTHRLAYDYRVVRQRCEGGAPITTATRS